MDLKEHTKAENLGKYAFMWNQVRLVIAAFSLIFGATPIMYRVFSPFGIFGSLLTISWVISGVAAGYLLYLCMKGNKKFFSGTSMVDMTAYTIAIVSGLHLGVVGLIGINVMRLVPSSLFTIVMVITGALYLWSAYHLHRQYNKSNTKSDMPENTNQNTPTV